jgi:hypothetical protein
LRHALLFVALLSVACGDPVGHPCARRGDSFLARDNCISKCLQLWTVICPNEDSIHPSVCAGRKGCDVGGCPDGQACYHFDDPFDVVAYCIPAELCLGASSSADALRDWETRAEERAAATRDRFSRIRRQPSAAGDTSE